MRSLYAILSVASVSSCLNPSNRREHLNRREQRKQRNLRIVVSIVVSIVAASLMFSASVVAAASKASSRPNVLIFLTDDQGFGDLGYHGNPKVVTPTMDSFARQSIELTQFYACPVCSPSRAALMTGRYPFRTGVTDVFGTAYNMRLEEVTLAEAMATAGYATGLFGKWHLGDESPRRPQDRGFQEVLSYTGICPRSYFDPPLLHNGRPEGRKGYCMDVFADAAIAFMRANKDRPFLLYLPANLIHAPLQVAESKVAPFRAAGLDAMTAKIYAMLQSVDDNFGRILAALRELGLEENTLVLFTSDNGPCVGSTTMQRYMAGLRGLKGTVYENGIRVPCFIRWPRQLQSGLKVDRVATLMDVMPTVLDACGVTCPKRVRWDGASLIPLLHKPDAPWPDRTVFFQWEGYPVPKPRMAFAVRNQRYKLVQAVGIADVQTPIRKKYAELCEVQGRGKLSIEGPPRYELFDIEHDPGETTDLASQSPDIVETMKKQYDAWFEDVWLSWHKTGGSPQ